MARAELLAYLDASALTKLVRFEPESDELDDFMRDVDAASSELAVAEVARAARRLATEPGELPLRSLLVKANRILQRLFLVPVDRALLVAAGGFGDPHLRTLDAVHLATAIALGEELESFVSYDRRQAAAAQAAGLPVVQPGT